MNLQGVALDSEPAAFQHHVVPLVVHVNKAPQGGPVVDLLADFQDQKLPFVVLRRAQAINARDGSHHDGVPAGQ